MKIGIIGVAGSGKDTVASIIQQRFNQMGVQAEVCRFAEPIKAIAREVFGPEFDNRDVKEELVPFTHDMKFLAEGVLWDAGARLLQHLKCHWRTKFETLLNRLLVKDEISPRIFQQYVGTDLFRAIDSNVWVNATEIQASKFEVALLPDVRFVDEAAVCDVLIVVNRPGVVAVAEHPSEVLANTLLQASFPKLITSTGEIKNHEPLELTLSVENYRRCTVGELRNTSCLGEFDLFEGKPQWFFSVFNHYSIERLEFMLDEVVMPALNFMRGGNG
ncbi:hypothetical protein ADP71_31610 [Vitreoscilla sp. C1]|uniref:hypothetical protein n=1 Tax=Vitreoscilla sp. (strain C1) TaxID=96942 RepID=UPI00148E9E8A|nr:hypothetical protein [Vitreoscilla sp. C1]AUZ06339.2 hypothetical protein ADP71_31610 [Vitreoscilla sp. C1]